MPKNRHHGNDATTAMIEAAITATESNAARRWSASRLKAAWCETKNASLWNGRI